MKNSTQIPFAFQDTPDPGANPGVGVRIKSLKKGPNEKESTGGTGENQPQVNKQTEKPAEPRLFDEPVSNQGSEDQSQSETEEQSPAQFRAQAPINSEAQSDLQSEAQPQIQSEAQSQSQSEAQPQLQSETKSQIQSKANQQIQSETKSPNPSEANQQNPSESDPQTQFNANPQIQSEAEPEIQSETKSPNPSEANQQNPSQTNSQIQSDSEPQTQSEGQLQTHVVAQVNPDSETAPQSSRENQTENKSVKQESTYANEYYNDSTNPQDQSEEDADLPVFRSSSLSTGFSVSEENKIKDSVTDSNEIENREVDEQDNTHGGTEKASKSTRGRKSLKTIDEGTELINIPPDEILFQKQYYAIGEVAEMFHVNQSLLRFWETEFDIIQPRKNRKGDRHFRPIDIKNLLLIHDLLRRRKLTIEGAKDFLKKNKRSPERFAMIQSLQKIKGFILEIKATL